MANRWTMRGAAVAFVCATLWSGHTFAQASTDVPHARRRAVVTYSVGLAGAATAIGVGTAIGLGMNRRCSELERTVDAFADEWACNIRGVSAALWTTIALVPIMTVAGTYLAHRRQGGQAPVWTAIAGSLLGTTAALVGVFGATSLPGQRGQRALVPSLVAAGVVTAFVPTLALEWSDRRRSSKRAPAAQSAALRYFMPRTAVLRDGVWLGVEGTL